MSSNLHQKITTSKEKFAMTIQENADHFALLTLLQTKGLGTKTLRRWRAATTSWSDVLHIDDNNHNITLSPRQRAALTTARHNIAQMNLADVYELYKKHNITLITSDEPSYPPLLREIPDAPLLLFVRGKQDILAKGPFVTIVGAREYTAYGKRAAYSLAYDLASAGVTVVSGLARGIDTIAHNSALDAGGTTIGVLGGSLDDAHITPRQNHNLAHAICTNGAIISEYPLFTEPSRYTFPARNRIMAAMAAITLVIEAADKSGTLITARNALEYNRDVCAVPGSIFSPISVGTNHLIRDGAKIITCVQDILEELPQHTTAMTAQVRKDAVDDTIANCTNDEKRILSCITKEALHVDKIAAMSKLKTTHVLSALSLLEIKGIVHNIGGHCYVRNR